MRVGTDKKSRTADDKLKAARLLPRIERRNGYDNQDTEKQIGQVGGLTGRD